jgi:Rps23 Pro-64 3,4-dihydroxylase Tpa1-like proline 4-hydroxylase
MKFEFIYDPVQLIIIRDVFSKKQNKEILEEAVKRKKDFQHSVIVAGKTPEFRSNDVAYYDNIYEGRRKESKLLSITQKLFDTTQFHELMASSEYPMHLFCRTNHHESQVSRYGNEGQEYKYHVDTLATSSREITFVYYFNEEPQKYTGGEITFTRSPIYKGKVFDKNTKTITLTPENNMAVIFGSNVAHRVSSTKSPKKFSSGRFSLNCWIGNI